MNRLVASLFRNEVNQLEPLSAHEQKAQHQIMINMSTSPDTLRSEKLVSQLVTGIQLEQIISKAKVILYQLKRSNARVQFEFSELRENLIRQSKALTEDVVAVNENENLQLIQLKISDVIEPLLSVHDSSKFDENERKKLISTLVINPRVFENYTETMGEENRANKIDAMRRIKNILDEYMTVRPGKRFYIPMRRFIDVPFVVAVNDKSSLMSEENATSLRNALIRSADSVISQIKPKIIDPKFSDGSLVLICANRKTFDLIKSTISNDFNGKWYGADLTVTALAVKNPISRSGLKTVLLTFTEPQFFHFNHLMEQLKLDNPSLLVRRWELQQPPDGKLIDATECIYVGVDIESLGVLEQMSRVAVLLKSTVTFDISYDENEPNFLPNLTLATK